MYGEKLKEIRKVLGLSQKEFSDSLQISVMALSRLETNDSSLKIEVITKIESMGVSLEWLIVSKGTMFKNDGQSVVDTSNTIRIPLLDVKASAGSGLVNYDEDLLEWISVPTLLLKQFNPNFVQLLEVNGDSMKPTFLDGDWIMVSTQHKDLQSERVFVIRVNDELKVKRLDKDMRGNIIITSDNPAFKTEELSPTEFTDFNIEIVGMVFGVLKKV